MKKLLLLIFLTGFYNTVLAQQAALSSGPEITLHFGIYHGIAGKNVEKQMRANGFGEESSASVPLIGSNDNPEISEGSIQLGFRFLVKQKYPIKALVQYKDSEAEGYAMFYDYLNMSSSIITVGGLGYLPFGAPYFRAGAGPALHVAKATIKHNEEEQGKKNFNKFGFILEGGFSYPANKRFFADLQVQYVYTGKEDLGTYTLSGSDFSGNTVTTNADFSGASFNSFILSVGVGFRLN